MKRIFTVVLIISIFINLYFFIGFYKMNKIGNNNHLKTGLSGIKRDNYLKTGLSGIKRDNRLKIGLSGIKRDNSKLTIIEALKSYKPFNSFLGHINKKYNLVKIVTIEFRKVKNRGEYFRLRKKFGGDQLLYTFIKIRNIELADKYMNYNFKLNLKIIDKTKEENMLFLFNKILKEYYNKGYYNKLPYKTKDGDYDYFRLSLMNYSLDKKIKLCKKGFKKEDNFNSCRRVVIYMAANKKNGYCSMLKENYYKKWCNDTLDYLSKK